MIQDEEKESVWIGQPTYTENLLKKLGMYDAKSVSTPVDCSTKLEPAKMKMCQ